MGPCADADGDDRQREAAIEVMQGHLGRLQAEQQRRGPG